MTSERGPTSNSRSDGGGGCDDLPTHLCHDLKVIVNITPLSLHAWHTRGPTHECSSRLLGWM